MKDAIKALETKIVQLSNVISGNKHAIADNNAEIAKLENASKISERNAEKARNELASCRQAVTVLKKAMNTPPVVEEETPLTETPEVPSEVPTEVPIKVPGEETPTEGDNTQIKEKVSA